MCMRIILHSLPPSLPPPFPDSKFSTPLKETTISRPPPISLSRQPLLICPWVSTRHGCTSGTFVSICNLRTICATAHVLDYVSLNSPVSPCPVISFCIDVTLLVQGLRGGLAKPWQCTSSHSSPPFPPSMKPSHGSVPHLMPLFPFPFSHPLSFTQETCARATPRGGLEL